MTEFQENLFLGAIIAILGSGAGVFFQHRSWKHQENVRKQDRELAAAQAVFEETSKNLDERLYRCRQIIFAFRKGDQKKIDQKFDEYREVLYRWNDNINRTYANIEIYFGSPSRQLLEFKIMKEVIYLGMLLEREYNNHPNKKSLNGVWDDINDINGMVYDFDRRLLNMIKLRNIGSFRI